MSAQLTKDTVEQKNQEIDDLTEMMMRCLENADVEDFIGKLLLFPLPFFESPWCGKSFRDVGNVTVMLIKKIQTTNENIEQFSISKFNINI